MESSSTKAKEIIIYDKKEDMLYVARKRKAYASVSIGETILDFDSRGFLVGMEIDGASKYLGLERDFLDNINSINMAVTYRPDSIVIALILFAGGYDKQRVVLSNKAELGHKSVQQEQIAVVRH